MILRYVVRSEHVLRSSHGAIDRAVGMRSGSAAIDCHVATERLDAAAFFANLAGHLSQRGGNAILALVEVQDGHHAAAGQIGEDAGPLSSAIDRSVGRSIGRHDAFCWASGRLLILLTSKRGVTLHQELRRLTKAIARVSCAADQRSRVTPAVGYASLGSARTAKELLRRAEAALECAKSSLEIEPFRYQKAADPTHRRRRIAGPFALWRKVPANFGLFVQLMLSLVFGFGAPFILYAICDALGSDISGAVYIGVVVVLLVTASTIWVEGFLALRATNPPERPGAPPPIATVIIPAYLPNEGATIVETIEAFLRLRYANTLQVIIAYNSPFDLPVEQELEAIAARYADDPRFDIEPIRIRHSTSKAQNVNAVVGRVRGEFVGIFDADHHPQPDSVERAWRWLSNGWDIVQGRCSIRNGHDSWVARMVAVEFEQIYAVSHPGRARLHGFGIFGGSNGFWRTAVLHETRMRHAMLTEDIDSSIRAVEGGYRIAGDRDLISEELAPTSLGQLLNQRLRWAQGWFQVSLRRIGPALFSRRVSVRQKLGLLHLLVWRELFPWYSIQVVPIMTYWVWIYGWQYIHWTIPVFVLTTIYTVSTGPAMVLFAYLLSRPSIRQRPRWFIEYLFVSMFFYAPFKDTLSRIAHIKEAMRERAWRVTPRRISTDTPLRGAVAAASVALLALVGIGLPARSDAQAAPAGITFAGAQISTLIGGEASTINAARTAASQGRNAEAAALFAKAIQAVPSRRAELLREYADALLYAKQPRAAVPLYRELLVSAETPAGDRVTLLRQLATALTWSGQYQAALLAYDRLCSQLPDDTELALRRARVLVALNRRDEAVAALGRIPPARWAGGQLGRLGDEVLVEAARSSARAAQSASAVRLFEQAMRHNPAIRPAVLRDYADQLAASGRTDAAIRGYRELIDHAAPGIERYEALAALVKVYQKAGRPGEAYAAYLPLIKTAPAAAPAPVTPAGSGFAPAIQRMMTAAQLAAAAGYHAASASLLQRASSDCTGCSGPLLLAHADQLLRTSPKGAAVLYRNALTKLARSSALYLRAQHGLATALTNAGMAGPAVEAWSAYLTLAPRDKRALLQRAPLLASLHQNDAAMRDYKIAVAIDPRDSIARRGLVDQTVVLARAAARTNQNAQSAALFSTAIGFDAARRRALLREYADQLSFSGHPIEAIALYQEARSDPGQSPADRRQTLIGLANAYSWTDHLDDALAVYGQLEQGDPQDQDVRWNRLVLAAKRAARDNDNRRSADLFGQAIALKADSPADIRRQYADQLSFTNRAGSAIAIYHTVLSSPGLTATDRLAAQQGLAQAYGWAGRTTEANAVYKDLASEHPADQSLHWRLLVGQARLAARNDQNAASAKLFGQAIKAQPARSGEIAREYADQLSFSGRAAGAVILYRQILKQPKLGDDERAITERSLARALDWSDSYGDAKLAYGGLIKRFPDEVALKRSLLIVSAREASAANHNEEAAGYLAKAVAIDPSKRADILGDYADQLTFSHKGKEAIPLYRELLAKDRLPADTRRHELALALALAWTNQPMAAFAGYKRLADQNPDDLDAANGMARMLSWAGRHGDAATAYRAILTRHSDDPAAMRGLAETEDWQGHHRAAQAILARRLAAEPGDLEARRLLAQSNVWSGRPDKAMTELRSALSPRTMMPGWQIASTTPAVSPPYQPPRSGSGTGQ